jgi:hypothetical protein
MQCGMTDRRSRVYGWGCPLWPHQQRALAAFGQARAAGSKSTYLVIPLGDPTPAQLMAELAAASGHGRTSRCAPGI